MNYISKAVLIACIFISTIALNAQQNPNQNSNSENANFNSIIKNSDISGLYYLSYNYNDKAKQQQFNIKRGYFTVKTNLSKRLSVRYTQDITLDEEGDDAGNIEIRVKYLYLKAKINDISFIKESFIEFGMVHRPWLEFEQKINDYRVQGRMFSEQHNLLSSADFGVTYIGLFGGKLSKEYRDKINSSFPGRYGSFAIGLFNGGGYTSIEKNNNKLFESRISLRPFPEKFTGFQISHGFSRGKGNQIEPASDFLLNIFMLSAENKSLKITAQYVAGEGNSEGSYSDTLFNSYKHNGYSFFSEVFIPKTKFAIFGRYDDFTLNDNKNTFRKTYIAGITYRFLKSKVLLDYQHTKMAGRDINYLELALEIAF